MPEPKNGERPYLASPVTPFLDPKIRGFRLFFWPPVALFLSGVTPNTLRH